MSMVFFHGIAIDSAKVLGFEVAKPTIKAEGRDGKNWKVISSACPVIMKLVNGESITLNELFVPETSLSGTFSDVPLSQIDYGSMSEFVHAQAEYVKQQAFSNFKPLADSLLKRACTEWNELTKAGAA